MDVLGQARAHGAPVGHGDADRLQHALDRSADQLQLARLGLLIDLHMHVRLGDRIGRRGLVRGQLNASTAAIAADAHHGVQQEVNVALAAIDLRGDRIDDEGHVVVNDFEDRVLQPPSVLFHGRVEETDLRLPRLPLRAEFPQR